MPKVESISQGAPIWMDLMTSDMEKAKSFYGELFGWSIVDNGEDFGHYHMASRGDDVVAGMMQKSADDAAMPDVWTVYLAVDNAEASTEAVKQAGGQVMLEPMVVGPTGTMVVASDPSGAVVGLWEPNEHKGFTVWGEHGTPAWHELMTLDFEAASAFYATAFDVDVVDMEFGDGGPASYRTIRINGEDKAGIMDATGKMPEGVPSNWLIYYGVTDTDAAAEKAKSLGGSVMVEPVDTPHGRFALLGDPDGAAFAIISV